MFIKHRRPLLLAGIVLTVSACTGLPAGVQPVQEFKLNQYLGTWYEIARLDHSFERGLNNVSATYSLREDGGLKVVNKGYSNTDQRWKEAEGKAYFMRGNNEGYLKVSFFGPFYGSYAVFGLDKENYDYAFVSGYNTKYLWLLSRTTSVSKEVLDKFTKQSRALGFNTDNLILVQHDK